MLKTLATTFTTIRTLPRTGTTVAAAVQADKIDYAGRRTEQPARQRPIGIDGTAAEPGQRAAGSGQRWLSHETMTKQRRLASGTKRLRAIAPAAPAWPAPAR